MASCGFLFMVVASGTPGGGGSGGGRCGWFGFCRGCLLLFMSYLYYFK